MMVNFDESMANLSANLSSKKYSVKKKSTFDYNKKKSISTDKAVTQGSRTLESL